MNKLISGKLLVIALAGVRRIAEKEGHDFMELVARSTNNKMTLEAIEEAIDAFEETGGEDNPEKFLEYLEKNSSKGGGLS